MSVDSVATGLSAGNYDVTITDANGCPSVSSVTIDEPTALQASTTPVDVTCFGLADGEATASATGGTGAYNYLWDTAAGSQNTATATGLAAGTFVVTVTDDNGCEATSNATINQNPVVQISASAVDATCNGAPDGQASVSASGGDGNYALHLDSHQRRYGSWQLGQRAATYRRRLFC
ncbi:MAG: SprB repeat-containing protein [Saprospiraceae bacterium]|nr:SprB repeat-containing protein [Saprospiraceae bacterium]